MTLWIRSVTALASPCYTAPVMRGSRLYKSRLHPRGEYGRRGLVSTDGGGPARRVRWVAVSPDTVGAREPVSGITYCPSCGATVGSGDQFCRSCGKRVGTTDGVGNNAGPTQVTGTGAPEGAPPQAPGDHSRRNRALVLGGILLALVAIAAVLVLTLGKSGTSAGQRRARAQAAAQRTAAAQQAALSAQLGGPFREAMGLRTRFYIAERSFLGAMADANNKLHQYQSATKTVEAETKQIENATSAQRNACGQPESLVPCPNPTYPTSPTAPEVQGDVSRLHSAVSQLAALNARALVVTPQPELKVFYAQLLAAINALSTDAQYNANTLTEGITEPTGNGSTGYVTEQKISTLHEETGLPSVRLMNRQAVQLIQLLRLEISQYDVPGGTDADPSDHSVAQ